MSKSHAKPAAIGFLSIVSHDTLGFSGGYLLLNPAGRPLEFHCTAPVKPNRAQEILYGATLEPYLYGEQIGQALVAKGAVEVLAVFVDHVATLTVRPFVECPVALVAERVASEDRTAPLLRFSIGCHSLAVSAARAEDRERFQDLGKTLGETFDLTEPFDRIHAAIDEAQKSTRAAA